MCIVSVVHFGLLHIVTEDVLVSWRRRRGHAALLEGIGEHFIGFDGVQEVEFMHNMMHNFPGFH